MRHHFKDISVDELREMTFSSHEREYLLVDVRQPDEYRKEHLPGALLIPLGELAGRLDELPTDRKLVFYCRSGKRSRAAAIFALDSSLLPPEQVYNLEGGILAWNGISLSGIPDLKTFAEAHTPEEALLQAMELERGAEEFYSVLHTRFSNASLQAALGKLAEAEQGHARLLYNHLASLTEQLQSFEVVYAALPAEILEGEYSVAGLLDYFASSMEHPCRTAVEVALNIEYGAYEMYRTLARKYADHGLEKIFMDIAQAEKGHLALAADAIGLCED